MGQTNDKPSKRQLPSGKSGKAPRFNRARFVNYELDTSEQAVCKGWDLSADNIWQEMSAMVDDGYKFTVKFDTYSEAYACFVQHGDEDGHLNSGLILAGRGSTCGKAVKQAIFKHKQLGGEWGAFAEKRSSVLDD